MRREDRKGPPQPQRSYGRVEGSAPPGSLFCCAPTIPASDSMACTERKPQLLLGQRNRRRDQHAAPAHARDPQPPSAPRAPRPPLRAQPRPPPSPPRHRVAKPTQPPPPTNIPPPFFLPSSSHLPPQGGTTTRKRRGIQFRSGASASSLHTRRRRGDRCPSLASRARLALQS